MEEHNRTDDFLLDQLKQGNPQSLEALFDQYWEPLYNAAVCRLQNTAEAQDVVQSLFVDVWQRRERLRVNTSLKAYLYSALKYSILDYVRAQTVREKYVRAIQRTAPLADHATAETLAYHELKGKVDRGIHSLPDRCGQVFRMRRLEHYSVKEIASQLGISPKTVENQLTKATKVLRWHLKEYVSALLFFLLS